MRFILVKPNNRISQIEIDQRRYEAIMYSLLYLGTEQFYGQQAVRLAMRIGNYRKENDVLGTILILVDQFMLIMLALNRLRKSAIEDFMVDFKTLEDMHEYIFQKGNAERTCYELDSIFESIFGVGLLGAKHLIF